MWLAKSEPFKIACIDESSHIENQPLNRSPTVIIPLRSFMSGKTRLNITSPEQRRQFLGTCAQFVISSSRNYPTIILTRDAEVAQWARDQSLEVFNDIGQDLNSSLEACLAQLANTKVERVTIVLGDIPLMFPIDLSQAFDSHKAWILKDRQGVGTNMFSFDLPLRFGLSYGSNSYQNHLRSLKTHGVEYVVPSLRLAQYDVDSPDDLVELRRLETTGCNLSAQAKKRIATLWDIYSAGHLDQLPSTKAGR